MGRFISADVFAATGQGVLGNNMFTYCLNNPAILADNSGNAAQICFGYDGAWNDSPWKNDSPGGGGLPQGIHTPQQDYGSVADKFYTVRAAQFVGNQISNFGHKLQEGYTQSYTMYHEAKIHEAHLMLAMFDTPKDIERSIDIITSTVGLEYAIYKVAEVSIVNPAAGAVAFTALGVIWAARELYRAAN